MAWTPASVLPAQVTETGPAATSLSAASTAAWTLGPFFWACQP